MPKPPLNAEDTTYQTVNAALTLREGSYPKQVGGGAQIVDDGLIDMVAIERFVNGDTTPRLTPREVVCVVAELAGRGETDSTIADRFGRGNDAGVKWICKLRARNRIPAAVIDYDDAHSAYLAIDATARAKASDARLAAAGVLRHAA